MSSKSRQILSFYRTERQGKGISYVAEEGSHFHVSRCMRRKMVKAGDGRSLHVSFEDVVGRGRMAAQKIHFTEHLRPRKKPLGTLEERAKAVFNRFVLAAHFRERGDLVSELAPYTGQTKPGYGMVLLRT